MADVPVFNFAIVEPERPVGFVPGLDLAKGGSVSFFPQYNSERCLVGVDVWIDNDHRFSVSFS